MFPLFLWLCQAFSDNTIDVRINDDNAAEVKQAFVACSVMCSEFSTGRFYKDMEASYSLP